ncbi:HAD-IA family hydrolase [Pannus brasiliensis CCIBt3594]|uniref:HAD-IA family hydrolase n=1 Tax=Pannus brasiliensis CCIBt3594 TaxID=1427578 RepID=A0AAW9R0X4_9CHRO
MSIKVVVFDFDGTIADTHDTFVEIVNGLAAEFGYKPVNSEEVEILKNLSSREVIERSKVPPFWIPFLLYRVKREFNKRIDRLEPFADLHSCLASLKERGYTLGIITSNTRENVTTFLKKHQLFDFFDFIYSGTPLFGKHKIIDRLIRQNRFQLSEVIYVGDETRDINAAKKSKVKAIAVGWGFNSPKILAKFQPDYLIHHPRELLEILDSPALPVSG